MKISKKAQEVLAFSMGLDPRHKYHFSSRQIDKITGISSVHLETEKKPLGFWYSWGGSWPLYLLAEYTREMGYSQEGKWAMDRLVDIEFVYKINIDFSRILRVRTKKDFKSLCEKYGRPSDDCFARHSDYPCVINWKKVHRDYWGIDIQYNADMSFDCFWYNRWDCHSGCIWRRGAIKDYKEVWKHKQESS